MDKRLRPKYCVMKVDKEGKPVGTVHLLSTNPENPNSPFVLMPRKDPAAFAAMITYARMCEPGLANEIAAWLRKIVEVPIVFGTQGERNLTAMRLRSILGIMD